MRLDGLVEARLAKGDLLLRRYAFLLAWGSDERPSDIDVPSAVGRSSSFTSLRNSLIDRPKEVPMPANRLAPKSSSKIRKIINSSGTPMFGTTVLLFVLLGDRVTSPSSSLTGANPAFLVNRALLVNRLADGTLRNAPDHRPLWGRALSMLPTKVTEAIREATNDRMGAFRSTVSPSGYLPQRSETIQIERALDHSAPDRASSVR